MKGVRGRFIFWILGWFILLGLCNLRLEIFPHILLIFWTLMPILSLIYSLLNRKKLGLSLHLEPAEVERRGEGDWVYRLHNQSKLMSFFLRFPDLKVKKDGKVKAYEIMVQPGEKREVRLAYKLTHTGPYSLDARLPLFEDLLGFFWLDFSKNLKLETVHALALPVKREVRFSESQEYRLEEFEHPNQQRSLSNVSDEIFSIDPIEQGESLAHAHWKLSARLQKWMIKHYSNSEQEPVRLLLDLREPDQVPEMSFIGAADKDLAEDQEAILKKRDHFADSFYALALRFLRAGSPVEVCDRFSRYTRFDDPGQAEELRAWIASRPFILYDQRWKLENKGVNRQILFVQDLNDDKLGNLLRYSDLGIPFLLVSNKEEASPEGLKSLQETAIETFWLDETNL